MLKKILFFLLVLTAASGSFFQPAQAGEKGAIKTVTLAVENMTCRMCPITIRKSLMKIDGVISAHADLDSKTATVRFDPHKTNIDALIAATTNAGYPSSVKQ
ncbi:MAG TPA: mercury resistance system periplasmic binding protein MerP [Gammaproteobacteria bacterium]|nr:mercury resistance system periplasmic binding protein MerP [Gammaproteobacteria bacterium]